MSQFLEKTVSERGKRKLSLHHKGPGFQEPRQKPLRVSHQMARGPATCARGFGWGPVLGPEDGAKAENPNVDAQTPTHTTKHRIGIRGVLDIF